MAGAAERAAAAPQARRHHPLDALRSIKAKLWTLVVVSVLISTGLLAIGHHARTGARIIVIFSLIACLLMAQVVTQRLVTPLREMTAAARAMAGGDYSRRVRTRRRDEIGALAATFNQMAAELQAADGYRRELVANVSHELRTPIAALRALLENVVDGVSAADPQTMTAALEQTERLGRLVSQLLDLSRLDSRVVQLDPRPFDVAGFLEPLVRVTMAAAEQQVDARLDVRPPGLQAVADPERLAQVVANLLDNARKHSPDGGLVTVSARAGASLGGLRIDVLDEGPGIPVSDRTRVFDRFTRGSSRADGQGRHGSDGGTGLGLAIARWAVELHGGTIQVVESDRGCLMRVELPGTPVRRTMRAYDAGSTDVGHIS